MEENSRHLVDEHSVSELTEELLTALGRSFRLEFELSSGSLGDAVRSRLGGLDLERPPTWGEPGSISQVAAIESDALDFYYRPHLFPGMEPGLRLAHHLQFDLLPRSLPLGSPLAIAAVLESYCHLSGDLLGWRTDPEGILLWIADISGHGVRAGLAAAVLRFLIADLDPDASLARRARQLNERMVAARNPDDPRALYMTIALLRIGADGRASWCSAGHPPILLRRGDGSIESLAASGLPIGLADDATYGERPLDVTAGDLFFLYTDGLLEARSPSGEELGLARLEALLRRAADRPLEVSRSLYRAVGEHKDTGLLDDDLTFLAAGFEPAG